MIRTKKETPGRHPVTFAIAAACMAGCTATSADSSMEPTGVSGPKADGWEEGTFCPAEREFTTHDGDDVVLCTRLSRVRPFVRLPADDLTDPDRITMYAAMSPHHWPPPDGTVFFGDRTGRRYAAVDETGEPLGFTADAGLPPRLRAPTYRYLFTVYRITGRLGEIEHPDFGLTETVTLADAVPVLVIDGCALDSALLGTWTGSASRRLLEPEGFGPFRKTFDEADPVPILVTFERAELTWPRGLPEWAGYGHLPDGLAYSLLGRIENFHEPAVGPDGSEYPALAELGEESPFAGATDGTVELYRHSNMHGLPFDDHWVLDYPPDTEGLSTNGMSDRLQFFDPMSLIAVSDGALEGDDARATLEVLPHIPYETTGHVVRIEPVRIGERSGSCE